MSLRQKPVYECDECRVEMNVPYIRVLPVEHEGCSVIAGMSGTWEAEDLQFCSLNCLFDNITHSITHSVEG